MSQDPRYRAYGLVDGAMEAAGLTEEQVFAIAGEIAGQRVTMLSELSLVQLTLLAEAIRWP